MSGSSRVLAVVVVLTGVRTLETESHGGVYIYAHRERRTAGTYRVERHSERAEKRELTIRIWLFRPSNGPFSASRYV